MKDFRLEDKTMHHLQSIGWAFGAKDASETLRLVIALAQVVTKLSSVNDDGDRTIQLLLPDGTQQGIVLGSREE